MIVEPNRLLMHDQFLDRVGSTVRCRLQQKSVEYTHGGWRSVPQSQAKRPGMVANRTPLTSTPTHPITILILQHPHLLVATSSEGSLRKKCGLRRIYRGRNADRWLKECAIHSAEAPNSVLVVADSACSQWFGHLRRRKQVAKQTSNAAAKLGHNEQ